jgi:hypothetical protein
LLGFNIDRYEQYPMLSRGLVPFTVNTFDNTNEKVLLSTLHFLLSIINGSFVSEISGCWPFYETREKNDFKRVVLSHFHNLMALNILDHADCRASLLTVAKGSAVWNLLWKLSNAAIDAIIISESNSFPSYSQSPEALTKAIHSELTIIKSQAIFAKSIHTQRRSYAGELENRLKAAVDQIASCKARLKELGASPEGQYLSTR